MQYDQAQLQKIYRRHLLLAAGHVSEHYWQEGNPEAYQQMLGIAIY
jgi:hypothetical protein